MSDSATKDQVTMYISKLMVQFLVEYEDSNGKQFSLLTPDLTSANRLTLYLRYQCSGILMAKNPRLI